MSLVHFLVPENKCLKKETAPPHTHTQRTIKKKQINNHHNDGDNVEGSQLTELPKTKAGTIWQLQQQQVALANYPKYKNIFVSPYWYNK